MRWETHESSICYGYEILRFSKIIYENVVNSKTISLESNCYGKLMLVHGYDMYEMWNERFETLTFKDKLENEYLKLVSNG